MSRFKHMGHYPLVISDAGRAFSRRPKQKNDCTIRAIVHATLIPYDVAYDMLAEAGRTANGGLNFGLWASTHPLPGFTFKKYEFRRGVMSIPDFCRLYPRGIFIVGIAGHVFAVRDGTAYDTYAVAPNSEVLSAWEVIHEV